MVDVDALRRRDARGADLAGADLRGANLADLDLRHARMCRADLRGADVSGANLAGADLAGVTARGARFHRACLAGANLAGADLTATNLTGADLAGACLVGATITHATLAIADLRGADLSGADLRKAVLLEARLDGAIVVGVRRDGADVARTILAPDGERYRRPAVHPRPTAPVGAAGDTTGVRSPDDGAGIVHPMILALVDLAGYTEYVKFHEDTIDHAHQVVWDLLDHLARAVEVPLNLNKFEGDAILLHANDDPRDPGIGLAVVRQLLDVFPSFDRRLAAVQDRRMNCTCLACRSVSGLSLKVVAHKGVAVARRVRHLDEIGGIDVILAHRLLKNGVVHRQYLLATEAVFPRAEATAFPGTESHVEDYPFLGTVRATVFPRPRTGGD